MILKLTEETNTHETHRVHTTCTLYCTLVFVLSPVLLWSCTFYSILVLSLLILYSLLYSCPLSCTRVLLWSLLYSCTFSCTRVLLWSLSVTLVFIKFIKVGTCSTCADVFSPRGKLTCDSSSRSYSMLSLNTPLGVTPCCP